MRRLYLLFLLTILTFVGTQAQKRLVLVEEFTNTGCGPCATWSPVLDSAIHYRLGDCIAIKYHSRFPNANDEFYNHDAAANQARVDFYQVTAVPTTLINGQELSDRTFGMMNTAIDWCLQQESQFGLTVSKTLANHQLTVDAALIPYYNIEDASNLRLFVAAIEEHTVAQTAWPNGEKELYYTMLKMITPADGAAVAAVFTANETYNFSGEWTVDFCQNEELLGVVAFLQNMDTKEILATAYAGPKAEGENQLALINLYDTPDLICLPNYYGKVIFRNDGANTITSATLNVKVNDIVKQYPWTGSLDYLDRDTLVSDGFTSFQLVDEGKNHVEVWLSDINGSDAVSNLRTSSFSNSVQASYGVQLKIYTDKKPEEITWKLYDSAGDVVREGGPYDGQSRKFITIDFELTKDDCYQLEFLDAGGDGIKGAYGNGYYQLFQLNEAGKTTRITQGDYEGAVFDVFFNLSDVPRPPHRLVLFEEFTNTSCDPCAEFSPALDKTIYERLGDMVAITYHYNYPSPQDPFYLANSTDAMARANFYDVTGVPSLRVNGEHVGAWGYEQYLDAYIDGAGAVPAKVNIDTEAALDTNNQLTVNVSLSPMGITNGENLRLFVAAVEERVEWQQPAANGERAWNYVMRKLLPSAGGQPLEAELTQVTPYQYEFTWKVENYTDEQELGLITFVQDMETKEILGTCYTPRPTGSTRAVKILQVLNTPNRICSPQFTSDLMVRNTGRETLTSATLNVSINGQLQQTPWTGQLDYLDIDTLRTPVFDSFTLSDNTSNEVELWLSDLNGQTEESVHKTLTISNAYKAQNAVRLTIMTDQEPEEITWKLYNSTGDVVCQGGPYTETRKKQVIDLPIKEDDCYQIEFEDAGGDGISAGRGYYMLHEVNAEGKVRLLVQQTYSDAHHNVFFSLQNAAVTAITAPYVTSPMQQPAYDLQGHPASSRSRIVITTDKKTIIKK